MIVWYFEFLQLHRRWEGSMYLHSEGPICVCATYHHAMMGTGIFGGVALHDDGVAGLEGINGSEDCG